MHTSVETGNNMMTLAFISTPEVFFMILIAILLFGSKRLPEIARTLGKGVSEFKKATNDIKKEFDKQSGGVGSEVKKIKHQIKESTQEIEKTIQSSSVVKDARDVSNNLKKS